MLKEFSPELISVIQLTKNNSPVIRQSYGKRIAQYYELELIVEGSGAIITNKNVLKTTAGRLFIRTPGMRLEGITPYFSYYVVFSDLSGELQHLVMPLYMENMEFLAAYFKTIRNNFLYPDAASELEIKACILQIITAIIRKQHGRKNPVVEKTIQYIYNNIGQPLSVSNLAQKSGYSLNHYTTLFKMATNELPSEFIKRCRIRKVCELLEETEDTIEKIAQECGFFNMSYFFRTFKQIQGETPNEYRKKLQNLYGGCNETSWFLYRGHIFGVLHKHKTYVYYFCNRRLRPF